MRESVAFIAFSRRPSDHSYSLRRRQFPAVPGQIMRGDVRRIGERRDDLEDALVGCALDLPLAVLLHIRVAIKRRAVGDDLVAQVEEPVLQIPDAGRFGGRDEIDFRMIDRSDEHPSELQSLMRTWYSGFF